MKRSVSPAVRGAASEAPPGACTMPAVRRVPSFDAPAAAAASSPQARHRVRGYRRHSRARPLALPNRPRSDA